MENLIAYIKNEKNENEKNINNINETISNSEYNIEKIDSMIVELTKNIDTTYEIFSPNAYDKDYNIVEIEKLNLKKKELLVEIDTLKSQRKVLLENKKKIDIVYDEIFDVEKQLANNVKNTQYLLEKEKRNLLNEFNGETIKLLEYQIRKQNHYFSNDIKKEIDLLDNKISLCENFIDIDINRARIEINKLREEVNNFEKKIHNKMFHVKHKTDNEKISLSDSIKDFISGYKKKIEMKIDYKYIGNKLRDSSKNILNVIRIIKEAIDNAEKFSNGSIITITVVVDDLVADIHNDNEMIMAENNLYASNQIISLNEEINISNENISDIHQINFIVDSNINKYNITIKIADNGDGFSLQDENIFIGNDLYGIYMMKYRTKLLDGIFNIQSDLGLGTTVTLVYQIINN